MNDLPSVVQSQVWLFADECLLYRPIVDTRDQYVLNKDLAALSQSADSWWMKYNPLFYNDNNPPQQFYRLCRCILTQVHDTQYLAFTISSDLRWERHIATTTTTANVNRIIGFLRDNLSRCPRQLRELVYFSRARLEYGAVMWDPYLAEDIQLFEVVLWKTAIFVSNNHKGTASVTDRINKLGWQWLESRREKARLDLKNKIVGGRVVIPLGEYIIRGPIAVRNKTPK